MSTIRPTAASRKIMAQYHGLAVNLRDLETDLRWGLEESPRIPEEWRRIALQPGVPKKRAVTIRLDEDVFDFFKAMGRGYLTRMNDVLRAFMQARLAGVVKGPEEVEYMPTPLESYLVEFTEMVQHMARTNAKLAAGMTVVEDDVETTRRKTRLTQLSAQIPEEWRVNLNPVVD